MNNFDQVAKLYDQIATQFNHTRRYNWPEVEAVVEQVVSSGDSILDLGCGNGRLYRLVSDKVDSYLGLDISQELIKIARANYPRAQFRLADISQVASWKGLPNYSVIACVAVLHHWLRAAKQRWLWKKISQHLLVNGTLIMTVWDLWQDKFLRFHQDNLVLLPYHLSDGRKITKTVTRRLYPFRLEELGQLAESVGLKVDKLKRSRGNLVLQARKC